METSLRSLRRKLNSIPNIYLSEIEFGSPVTYHELVVDDEGEY